jgi:ribosomal protein L35AE/L33A
MSRLVGNWFIYRRLAKPGAVDPNTWLIKYLNIQAKKSETEGIGEISCYRMETSQQIPCTITLKGTTLQITAKSLNWKFSVYQADGKNLVFGGEELLYYSKPLQDN